MNTLLCCSSQGPAFSIGARPADKALQRDQSSPGPGSYAADVVATAKQGERASCDGQLQEVPGLLAVVWACPPTMRTTVCPHSTEQVCKEQFKRYHARQLFP